MSESTAETADPILVEMLTESAQRVQQATEALHRAHGAHQFVKSKIARKYALGKGDSLDDETGLITRTPKPEAP